MKYRCDDCGYTAAESKFDEARSLWERLDDGCMHTSKECPKDDCGALAYPVESLIGKDQDALDQIAALLTGKSWSADTIDAVAEIVKGTGREIEELIEEGGPA